MKGDAAYKARRNAKARERYRTDTAYRKKRITLATARNRTKRGRVQQCLRIAKVWAKKKGHAPCNADADSLIKVFTGKCFLCKRQNTALVIDHDHVTGEFRGWICGNCNSGLGFFKDNVEHLRQAVTYLDDTQGEERKNGNPKDELSTTKAPLHLWPQSATLLGSLALLDGALKYGKNNWRVAGVRASVYIDALHRHIAKWWEGQDLDPDSGLPHEAHMLACLAIIIDAKAAGKLTDDRAYPGGYIKLLEEMTPHVARLREKHKDKAPTHYTRGNSLTFKGVTTPTEQYEPVDLDVMVHNNPMYYWLKQLRERKEGHDNNE